ncbi:tetratricopeptide repeat protein [Nannocystaceae bacterium ST9]
MLLKMVETKPDEPFVRYGLAMEYRKLQRTDEAIAAFTGLLDRFPTYVPAYLMFGNLLDAAGRREQAIDVYERGLAAAERAGDDHALGELRAARDGLA